MAFTFVAAVFQWKSSGPPHTSCAALAVNANPPPVVAATESMKMKVSVARCAQVWMVVLEDVPEVVVDEAAVVAVLREVEVVLRVVELDELVVAFAAVPQAHRDSVIPMIAVASGRRARVKVPTVARRRSVLPGPPTGGAWANGVSTAFPVFAHTNVQCRAVTAIRVHGDRRALASAAQAPLLFDHASHHQPCCKRAAPGGCS